MGNQKSDAVARAFQCFVGAWSFINGTVQDLGGDILPDWHGPHPGGISIFSPSGYNAYIVTSNDVTEPHFRPTNVSLPAQPGDSEETWATIAQHSLAAGGPFCIINATDCPFGQHDKGKRDNDGKKDSCHRKSGSGNSGSRDHGDGRDGPSGYFNEQIWTSTLPSFEGVHVVSEFGFYDDCNTWMLKVDLTPDVAQVAWFERLPDNSQGQALDQ